MIVFYLKNISKMHLKGEGSVILRISVISLDFRRLQGFYCFCAIECASLSNKTGFFDLFEEYLIYLQLGKIVLYKYNFNEKTIQQKFLCAVLVASKI